MHDFHEQCQVHVKLTKLAENKPNYVRRAWRERKPRGKMAAQDSWSGEHAKRRNHRGTLRPARSDCKASICSGFKETIFGNLDKQSCKMSPIVIIETSRVLKTRWHLVANAPALANQIFALRTHKVKRLGLSACPSFRVLSISRGHFFFLAVFFARHVRQTKRKRDYS